MKKQSFHLKTTLLISILIGIILPFFLGVKDPVYVATFFSLVWAIYSLILFGYVFFVGWRNRNKSEKQKEETSLLQSIQEWEALCEITTKKKDQEQKKIFWS